MHFKKLNTEKFKGKTQTHETNLYTYSPGKLIFFICKVKNELLTDRFKPLSIDRENLLESHIKMLKKLRKAIN